MKGNAEHEVKAALCLKYSYWTSRIDHFNYLFCDVFEKGRSSKYFDYAADEKIRKYFDKVKNGYPAVNADSISEANDFRQKFESTVITSKFINENYSDLREEFFRERGDCINSLNLGYFSEQFVSDSFKHLTNCISMAFSTNSLDFVPQLPKSVKTLELTVNEMKDFTQERANDTITNLKLLSLNTLSNLQNITSKFAGVENLTIECTEEVTEAQVNLVIEALKLSKIQKITFIPHARIHNLQFNGSLSWSSLPECIGSKNIIYTRKNNV